MTEILKDFYWTVPFLLFLAGYQSFNLLFKTDRLNAPHLVGKPLQLSLQSLGQHKLNARLITEKEDADLPEGTVLSQIPAPGQIIKPHQTIFLVASRQPAQIKTPKFQGRFYNDIMKELKIKKLKHKAFFLEVPHPDGLCIAQVPQIDEPLGDGLTLYFAKDSNAQVLFPDFQGLTVEEAKTFLAQYNIEPQIYHSYNVSEDHSCSHCRVKEQKPLAGSFINLKNKFLVQLKI